MPHEQNKKHLFFLMALLVASTSFFIYSVKASSVPVVGPVHLQSLTAVVGVPYQVTATFTAAPDSGIPVCYFFDDLANRGRSAMVYTGNEKTGILKTTYTFTYAGSHVVYVTCEDQSGDTVIGTVASLLVTPTDIEPPYVGNFSPTAVQVGIPTTFTAYYADAGSGVTDCAFYVNDQRVGPMTMIDEGTNPNYAISSNGRVIISYAFPKAGSYNSYIECRDGRTNVGVGAVSTIVVSDSAVPTPPVVASSTSATSTTITPVSPSPITHAPVGTIQPGTLIKTHCWPLFSNFGDPCSVVYYFGNDGMRHAYPNEKVFYSWHTNFSGVMEIDEILMDQIPLGKNVTYRPGYGLVKFTGSPKVYAVDQGGTLRTSENLALALYGADWNQKIDDLSDAFFTNYVIGSDITSIEQYNPAQVMAAEPVFQ
jgi:hypothetical protein